MSQSECVIGLARQCVGLKPNIMKDRYSINHQASQLRKKYQMRNEWDFPFSVPFPIFFIKQCHGLLDIER